MMTYLPEYTESKQKSISRTNSLINIEYKLFFDLKNFFFFIVLQYEIVGKNNVDSYTWC